MLISTAAVCATDTDTDSIISAGIGSCEAYLEEQLTAAHDDGGVWYGYEWYIITMLRAGKSVSQEILDEYYASVCETVKEWDADIKPTDAERTALALTVMGKDITDVDGVNLAELICNSEKLRSCKRACICAYHNLRIRRRARGCCVEQGAHYSRAFEIPGGRRRLWVI